MRQNSVRCWQCAGVFLITAASYGQWTATSLHPAGELYSNGYGGGPGVQVGATGNPGMAGGNDRAAMWNGSSGSWVDLHPTGMLLSAAHDASATQQVGSVSLAGGFRHASIWSGSSASWVDLHPTGAVNSVAVAIDGSMQGGTADFSSINRASLWSGNAASWQDLSPAGSGSSNIAAMKGGMQVGTADFGFQSHAGFWTGTSASFVDLHPASAAFSVGQATDGTIQAGAVFLAGTGLRASLWNGTAASWSNLNPTGATESDLLGAMNGYQVGYAIIGGRSQAGIWQGTSGSFVSLDGFLPSGYLGSMARSIDVSGGTITVTGIAFSQSGNRAMIWTQPVPEPASIVAMLLGALGLARRRRRIG